MSLPKVSTATLEDKDKVLATMSLAFAQDPLMRWFYPESYHYIERFPELTGAIGENAFGTDGAITVDDFSGAALWLPPGVDPDEDLVGGLVEDHFEGEMRDNLFKMLEAMDSFHPHDEPCWYLAVLGVDINRQGKGLGALLMKDVLRKCDEGGILAYLESSNPANVSFYERHGFEVMGQVNCGNPLPMQPMLRTPR